MIGKVGRKSNSRAAHRLFVTLTSSDNDLDIKFEAAKKIGNLKDQSRRILISDLIAYAEEHARGEGGFRQRYAITKALLVSGPSEEAVSGLARVNKIETNEDRLYKVASLISEMKMILAVPAL